MRQKNEIRKYEKELRDTSITLTKFLISYCGISNERLKDTRISHKDVKQLIPSLKRVSFEWLMDNKVLVDIGKIIPVVDFTGSIVPYIRPSMKKEYLINLVDNTESKFQTAIEDLVLNENLEPYQISLLCNKYKVARRFREYRILNRLLKSKLMEQRMSVKKYKVKKYELMVKESGKDEY